MFLKEFSNSFYYYSNLNFALLTLCFLFSFVCYCCISPLNVLAKASFSFCISLNNPSLSNISRYLSSSDFKFPPFSFYSFFSNSRSIHFNYYLYLLIPDGNLSLCVASHLYIARSLKVIPSLASIRKRAKSA